MDQDSPSLSAEPLRPTPPSTVEQIFLGKDGLRAGWSLLIFAALFVGFAMGVHAIGHGLHPAARNLRAEAHSMNPWLAIVEYTLFFGALLSSWIMSKIERRPLGVYGLGGRRKLPNFLTGLAWGIILLSLLVVTLAKSGLLVIESRLLFGADILRYGAIWLVGFLGVGLLEEYLFRGYLQYTLTRGLAGFYRWAFKTAQSTSWGFWTSAAAVSFYFGFGHRSNPGESPVGLVSAAAVALVFCLSLWRTGSLWWAIGFHSAWDWGQSFLYGVADSGVLVQDRMLATHPAGKIILSGGSTGPEGSIFVLVVLAIAVLVVLFTLPRGRYGSANFGVR